MLRTPAFFFPTTIYMLDDDKHFMQMLAMAMPSSLNKVVFNNSYELFESIQEHYPLSVDAPPDAKKYLPLNTLEKVRDFMESGYSKYLVSTIIIDQHLEETDGLDILKQLDDTNLMKILISNFIDSKELNKAYNDRLIDAFIPKMSHDFIANLSQTLLKLQRQFFIGLSETLPSVLKESQVFKDEVFAEYFSNLTQNLQVSSCVLRPSLNIFELYTSINNKKVNLFMATDQDFDDLLNSIQAEDALEREIERIKLRQAIPCVVSEEIPSGAFWAEYMQKVTPIYGKKTYYVSCQANF